jgi:drug/metabolite transporter (DMT)-like permease
MAYALAVAAALTNAFTSIFQRMGVEDAPSDATMHLGLLKHAIRRGVWLAGFVLLAIGFLLQAVALHLGALTSVQPILTTELLFLVAILALWFHFKVRLIDWAAALAAAAGLAGFLYFSQPGADRAMPGGSAWAEVGGSCAAAMVISVLLARTGPRWWRAAMFGLAAAIGYAFTAALTKVVTGFVAQNWVSMFSHWETYGIAVAGLASVFLAQNAYHAGPIAASQSTLVLADPLVSILIGIALFNDNLRTSEPWGALEAISLVVLFAGAGFLCNSPLIGGVKSEDAAYHEMLSAKGREHWVAEHEGRQPDEPAEGDEGRGTSGRDGDHDRRRGTEPAQA